MDTKIAAPRHTLRWRITRLLRKRWNREYGNWKHRILALLGDHHPWWDWGHPLMILVGDCVGGNWSEPEPPTWWYRFGPPTRMWRTNYPRHPLKTFDLIKGDFDEYERRTEGLTEDEKYEWKAIAVDQDGELILGHRYWGKPFYGLNRYEVVLLRKYLRMWNRHNWFGLRTWLWHQALHAAVHCKQPFTCQQPPPRGQGGYSHWYCTEPRNHDGLHRFANMVWGDVGGEQVPVTHVPDLTQNSH